MHILALLTDLYDASGGIQTFNRALVKALDELADTHGWTITLLVLNDQSERRSREAYFSERRTQYRPFRRSKGRFAAAAITHSVNASMIVAGHINFAPLLLPCSMIAPGVPTFLVLYGIEAWCKFSLMRRLAVRRIGRLVSISTSTRNQAAKLNGLDRKDIAVLPCSLDPLWEVRSAWKSRQELSLPAGRMILSVARLDIADRYKGIEVVISALLEVRKEIHDAFYVIVGDGSDRGRLEQIVQRAGLTSGVIFAGRVQADLLPSYYHAADLFVLPSPKEGFGIVFLEAMSYGKPCIGARAGGIPEVIKDDETGLLVEADDALGLAAAIVRLFKNDGLRASMGLAGETRFRAEFSFEMFRRRLERLLCGTQVNGNCRSAVSVQR